MFLCPELSLKVRSVKFDMMSAVRCRANGLGFLAGRAVDDMCQHNALSHGVQQSYRRERALTEISRAPVSLLDFSLRLLELRGFQELPIAVPAA